MPARELTAVTGVVLEAVILVLRGQSSSRRSTSMSCRTVVRGTQCPVLHLEPDLELPLLIEDGGALDHGDIVIDALAVLGQLSFGCTGPSRHLPDPLSFGNMLQSVSRTAGICPGRTWTLYTVATSILTRRDRKKLEALRRSTMCKPLL